MNMDLKAPVLILSFNNCELHCCQLDGFKDNTNALLYRLASIDEFFNNRSNVQRYRIWFNIDENNLSDDLIIRIIQSIVQIEERILKIAFIGVGKYKRRFNKQLKKLSFCKPFEYFSDAEKAKEWLR